MTKAYISVFGIPLTLLSYSLFWLLSSLVWRFFEFSWHSIFLIAAALIAAGLVVLDRSFSIAVACVSLIAFLHISVIYTVLSNEMLPANLEQIILAGLCDLFAIVALWLSWRDGHIRSTKVDWLAALATVPIIGTAAIFMLVISSVLPGPLEAFGVVVLVIGAGAFVMLKRTVLRRFLSNGEPVATRIG